MPHVLYGTLDRGVLQLSYYELLGLEPPAGQGWEPPPKEVVERAYRKAAVRYHPDKCGDPRAKPVFERVQVALEVLCDEEARAAYDESLLLRARRDQAAADRRKQDARLDSRRKQLAADLERKEREWEERKRAERQEPASVKRAAERQEAELDAIIAQRKRRRVQSLAELEQQLARDGESQPPPPPDCWAHAFALFGKEVPQVSHVHLPGIDAELQRRLAEAAAGARPFAAPQPGAGAGAMDCDGQSEGSGGADPAPCRG
eukprot:TRINITY_DN1608_c1_g1_i1.p1 TRINITY_DN1608_c1_g1~~TRINITY_DN1608_c1_g1_i1.p1  ORF type:complete len:284 (+),score=122.33 TRINITY_DN1608_c1_g1_i1:75-854(+)